MRASKPQPFTNQDVHRATEIGRLRVRDALKLAAQLQDDPRRDSRLKRGMCAPCFYAFRLAGQAMTRYTCAICEDQQMHHNTAVPKLCGPCGNHHGLCVQCGGLLDDDGRQRPSQTQPLLPPGA